MQVWEKVLNFSIDVLENNRKENLRRMIIQLIDSEPMTHNIIEGKIKNWRKVEMGRIEDY